MHQRVPTVEFIHKFRARIVLTLPTALRSRYCFRRLATISLDHHRASLITENFSLTHFDGLSVPCALRLLGQKSSSRLVIIAPGFLGFKDWGFFPYLAERLCLAGFATLAFSHALSGVRDNPLEITDTQAFSKNSTSQELKDWDVVLDSVLLGRLPH